jgi:hypothetical protein
VVPAYRSPFIAQKCRFPKTAHLLVKWPFWSWCEIKISLPLEKAFDKLEQNVKL